MNLKRLLSGAAILSLVLSMSIVLGGIASTSASTPANALWDKGSVQSEAITSTELTPYRSATLSCESDRHNFWGETKAEAIEALPDGGFVVAGYVHRCPEITDFEIDGWVARFDAKGAMLWSRSYQIWDQSWGRAIAVMPDGGFVVAGGVAPDAGELMNNTDIAVWRIEADGTPSWARVFHKPESEDKVYDIIALAGGGVALAGFVASEDAPAEQQGYCANEYAYSKYNGTNSLGRVPMSDFFGAETFLPCRGFLAQLDDGGKLIWQTHNKGIADNLAFQSLHEVLDEEGGLFVVGRSMGESELASEKNDWEYGPYHPSERIDAETLLFRFDLATGEQRGALQPYKPPYHAGTISAEVWVSYKDYYGKLIELALKDYFKTYWSVCALGKGFQYWYRIDLHYAVQPFGLGGQFTGRNCFPEVTLHRANAPDITNRFPRVGRIQDHAMIADNRTIFVGAREIDYPAPILVDLGRNLYDSKENQNYENFNMRHLLGQSNPPWGAASCAAPCRGRTCFGDGCVPYPMLNPIEFYQRRVGTWLWWMNDNGDVVRDQRLDRMYVK